MKDFQRQQTNPFGGSPAPSVTEVDAALYGTVDVPVSGRIVSKPIEIMQIRADLRQPRRAVPPVVRLHWDGKGAIVPNLLDQWQQVAEKRAGIRIDVPSILNGKEGLPEIDQAPAVTQEFIALCRLAQSIHKDGVKNGLLAGLLGVSEIGPCCRIESNVPSCSIRPGPRADPAGPTYSESCSFTSS